MEGLTSSAGECNGLNGSKPSAADKDSNKKYVSVICYSST
jgi:hypothetical protein